MTQQVNQTFWRLAETVASRGMRPHFVYFLLAECNWDNQKLPSLLKVGTSADPNARLRSLKRQVGPDWLQIFGSEGASFYDFIGVVVGDLELEQLVHKALDDFRIKGFKEWFWYDAEAVDRIEGLIDQFGLYPCCEILPDGMVFSEAQAVPL